MRLSFILLIAALGGSQLAAQNTQPAVGKAAAADDVARIRFVPKDLVRQYAETPAAYVTDLRPLIDVLANKFPESVKDLRISYPATKAVAELKVSLSSTISEDQGHKNSSRVFVRVALFPSLRAAETELEAILQATQLFFSRGSFSGQSIGELSFAASLGDNHAGMRILRRNAIVTLDYHSPTDVSKIDRKTIGYTPDPGIGNKCEDLVRQIDQFLLNAH